MPAYSSTTSTVHRENQKKLTRIVSFETNTAAKRSESDKICHVAPCSNRPNLSANVVMMNQRRSNMLQSVTLCYIRELTLSSLSRRLVNFPGASIGFAPRYEGLNR